MNWADPTPARVMHIARRVRRADRVEVGYSHGITGEDAVVESWKHSRICRCIDGDNGDPVGICGVDGTMIWLLATDGLLATASHRRQFIRGGRKWVDELMASGRFPVLENWAFAANRETLRWLEHLGFFVDTPAPYGPSCQLFCHFWREA